MSSLAWPLVALLLGGAVLWRLDAFARRWTVGQLLAKRVAEVEAHARSRASLDEVTVLRDRLQEVVNRLGPKR